jgi:hypothetical protein
MTAGTADITISRIAGSVGWFVTKNIIMKAEYVNQEYNNLIASDIRSGGKFNGAIVKAVVGF